MDFRLNRHKTHEEQPAARSVTGGEADQSASSRPVGFVLGGGSDLEEVRQARQHVGGDGRDVVDALTVFQKHPDQQQHRPGETERQRDAVSSGSCFFIFPTPSEGHEPDDGVFLPVDQQELGGLPVLSTCRAAGRRFTTTPRALHPLIDMERGVQGTWDFALR